MTASPRLRATQYLQAYCDQMQAMWALVSAEVAPPEGLTVQQLAGWRNARTDFLEAAHKATRNWRVEDDDETEEA